MIYLMEFDRQAGRRVTFRAFDDSQWEQAEIDRHRIELDLNRKGIEHEVVLLEADSEETLRRTHRRYFEDLREMLDAASRDEH